MDSNKEDLNPPYLFFLVLYLCMQISKLWSRWFGNITHYHYNDGKEIITMGHQILLEALEDIKTNEMKTAVTTVPKIYYLNSKERKVRVPWISKRGLGHITEVSDKRVTIAISGNEQVIMYGIAICSPEDNFVREKGKELAKQRMLNGFGVVPRSKVGIGEDLQSTILAFARNLLQAVEGNPSKFEHRISKFNNLLKNLQQHPPVDV